MKYINKHIQFSCVIVFSISVFFGCKPDKLFTTLSPEHTNITFANNLKETEEININQYLYAHNGGGVAIGDINNDGLPDIYLPPTNWPTAYI